MHALSPLFAPTSLAIVGASPHADSLGCFVLRNVLENVFQGPCFAVNPKYREVLGMPSYPSLAALPQAVDLAVVTAPAACLPTIVEEGAARGVKAMVILSSGFDAIGASGRSLLVETLDRAKDHGIRLLGPNCLGLARPGIALNATFARASARAGRVALVSQSGAICTAVLDLAETEALGFSSVISLGTGADVDFGEILDYLRQDVETDAILLYVEGVHSGRAFAEALRAAALEKPVIVMKAGRYASGSKAASSHSGALMGRDEVFEALLRRCGAVRVDTYTQLIAAARILSGKRLPKGERLALLTNGGGLAVIAADSASQRRVELSRLESPTVAALDAVLPKTWSHANPIDIIGDADARRFADSVGIAVRAAEVDALAVLYCPTVAANPAASAQAVADAAASVDKPVLAVWLDKVDAQRCADIFEANGIPHFDSPEDAVEAFALMTAYSRNQAELRRAPPPYAEAASFDAAVVKWAASLAMPIRAQGRRLLDEHEAKTLLRAFGFPVSSIEVAADAEAAVRHAETLGYPVVLKIHSADISHKSDVDGVRLALQDAVAVRAAFEDIVSRARRLRPQARIAGVTVQPMLSPSHARELIVGVSTDPVFGPIVSFGAGGVAVEVIRDIAVALPPLDRALAHDLIERTRVHDLLAGYRNVPPADVKALGELLVLTSHLVQALPWIEEIDLNPVLAHPGGLALVDARIVISASAASA